MILSIILLYKKALPVRLLRNATVSLAKQKIHVNNNPKYSQVKIESFLWPLHKWCCTSGNTKLSLAFAQVVQLASAQVVQLASAQVVQWPLHKWYSGLCTSGNTKLSSASAQVVMHKWLKPNKRQSLSDLWTQSFTSVH